MVEMVDIFETVFGGEDFWEGLVAVGGWSTFWQRGKRWVLCGDRTSESDVI